MRIRHPILLIAAISATTCLTYAQEPIFMEAATHPGAHQFYGRALAYYSEYSEFDESVEESEARVKLAYGLAARWAALADLHGRQMRRNGRTETGFATATLRLKHRLFKHDTGPINTWMASVLGGIEVPGPQRDVAPARTAIRLGAVTTAIRGRHGVNVAVDWTTAKKRTDTVDANASYLFRLAPTTYAADTRGAWYIALESLNTFANDGDRQASWAPGLLYEARRWAAEIAFRQPWLEKGDIKLDAEVALGARYLF